MAWKLIRGQAGQSAVVRTSGFSIKDQDTDYRDSQQTTVEKEDRVVLRDLQEQIEGEAHFVFSGQIVREICFTPIFAAPTIVRRPLPRKAAIIVPLLSRLNQ